MKLLLTDLKSPHGELGINKVGHRKYVGGYWHEIGILQFNFLSTNGLKPHHYLLDIACGSLRAGIHFIPYLNSGHYLGVDKESKLINMGIEHELGRELYDKKKPNFIVSEFFEFELFNQSPDYVIAQSLFTHLPPNLINDCFFKLRKIMKHKGVFYATYFEVKEKVTNLKKPHDHRGFRYTRSEMEEFGNKNSFDFKYIGQWNHPRGQVMTCYTLR